MVLLPAQLSAPATALLDILPKLLETCKQAATHYHEAIDQENPLMSHMHILCIKYLFYATKPVEKELQQLEGPGFAGCGIIKKNPLSVVLLGFQHLFSKP